MLLLNDDHKKNFIHQNINIKILMYHRISEDENLCKSHWTYVSSAQLRKQLLLLDRLGFTPITFNDYLLYINGELSLPRKPIILSFDDGYEDVYRIAFPMLKEFGMKAIFFVLGDSSIKTDVWNNGDGTAPSRLINDEQITDMHESGFEIGSHTMTHPKLTLMPINIAWEEISVSKQQLEFIIKSTVKSFSYPYGAVNSSIKRLVIRAGYLIACGVFTGPPRFGTDRFDFRRIAISNSTNSINFAAKILTPFEYYEWFGAKTSKAVHRSSNKNNFSEIHEIKN